MPARKSTRFRKILLACFLLVGGCAAGSFRPPDVRYEPTPMEVVGTMLDLTAIRNTDVVADLGCGDGRLVIEALRRGGGPRPSGALRTPPPPQQTQYNPPPG